MESEDRKAKVWWLFSKLLNETSENGVMFRPYGSAAEDLKCHEAYDGDVDIMIIPTSENLTILDDLLEYLPEHPMHVRIKGVGHPVLQSCLVEGTEYVGSSALKNFDSAIYGRLSPYIVDTLSYSLQLLFSEQRFSSVLQCSCRLNNKTSGPAVTVDLAQSFQWFNS